MKMIRAACFGLLVTVSASITLGQGDPDVVARIIDEGKYNSQVWEHLTYLSKEIGPRLTGSTNLTRANAWTRDQFESYGLKAYLYKWGEIPVGFDRGPSYARMVEPAEQDFEMTSRSWSAGTDGPAAGPVLKEPETLEELNAMRDQLEGAWILSKPEQRQRWRRGGEETDEERAAREAREKIASELDNAGILGRIVASRSDLLLTGGERGWRNLDYANLPTDVSFTVRREDYDAMNSRLADGEEVRVEADLVHNFVEGPIPLYNTIAEIRGTEWPDEVVIISGHLDSWDGPGTEGAQDNATGCSTALEAARILMAADAKPKRTIRFILWTGEEQGLLGSSAYVENLSDEEKARISAAFVDDGGTNYVGGVSCIPSMEPMLAEAIAPVQEAFPDLPMELDIRERMSRFGGSDHAPFVRAGIPGFFYTESGSGGREGKDYRYIHHTQHDKLRYAVPEYLVQSATASAVLAYNLACADTLLPREVEEPAEEQPIAATASSAAGSDNDGATTSDDASFVAVEGPVTGTWIAQLITEDGPSDMTITMKLKMNKEGQVRGTLESDYAGLRNISRGSFDEASNKLSFATEGDRGAVNYNATLNKEEGVLTGTLSVEDTFSIDFVAKKAEPAATAATATTAGSGVEQ